MAKETKNKNSVPQGKKKMTKTNNKKKETSKKSKSNKQNLPVEKKTTLPYGNDFIKQVAEMASEYNRKY